MTPMNLAHILFITTQKWAELHLSFPPRQVSLNLMNNEKNAENIQQEKDNGRKLIHSK